MRKQRGLQVSNCTEIEETMHQASVLRTGTYGLIKHDKICGEQYSWRIDKIIANSKIQDEKLMAYWQYNRKQ